MDAFPLLVQSTVETDLVAWTQRHNEWLRTTLCLVGAVLLRGFGVKDPISDFHRFGTVALGALGPYVYRSTPRTSVARNVYTATEYPAQLPIPQHSENAYSRSWPLKLAFFCMTAAKQGGQTPLSRNVAVTRRMSSSTRDAFRRRGVLYVRNYGDLLDLPWSTVFQTDVPADVERFCRLNGIEFEWGNGRSLRTRQRCQGLAAHPVTGEEVWFNQAHLFHVSGLDPATKADMLQLFTEDELPRNAFYGDGAPIEARTLEEIRSAFDAEIVTFEWQENDILLLDNMLVSHGRRPYAGPRKVLVAMSEPYSSAGTQTSSIHI